MDNNVDTNDSDIDTIDINIDITINDTNNIDIYVKSINLSNEKKYLFQFSMKTLLVSKLIEITCSWAHILHAHMFLTQTLWWDHQKLMKILRNIDFIDFSIDQKFDWSINRSIVLQPEHGVNTYVILFYMNL